MKFPTIFLNHGGGPLPLLGAQPDLASHMRGLPHKLLPSVPKAIVVVSAHYESDPIRITSSAHPSLYYDYSGFPHEAYEYKYPVAGSPRLARKIQELLNAKGLKAELDENRGLDHGAFVPLMLMYPDANVPVVEVSLHPSLSTDLHLEMGKALKPLRDEDSVLIIGSGYAFHNMQALLHPTKQSLKASRQLNDWLVNTMQLSAPQRLDKLKEWEEAPGARMAHPRQEHFLPLLVATAAAGETATAKVVFENSGNPKEHTVSGFFLE